MATILTDPDMERQARASRAGTDGEKWDEVWDGVLVMPTLPNDEHQEIVGNFLVPLITLKLGKARPGVNVTDRHPDWKENYRCPDVVVYLDNNPAINHGTHWLGGPDFLVEIISPGDLAWDKLEFYAEVSTREVLIVDRDPWALELYQLRSGKMKLAGRSDLANPSVLGSSVMPLTFQMKDGSPRPVIHIAHASNGQTWTA
jgi:Uma2 family endonuclease